MSDLLRVSARQGNGTIVAERGIRDPVGRNWISTLHVRDGGTGASMFAGMGQIILATERDSHQGNPFQKVGRRMVEAATGRGVTVVICDVVVSRASHVEPKVVERQGLATAALHAGLDRFGHLGRVQMDVEESNTALRGWGEAVGLVALADMPVNPYHPTLVRYEGFVGDVLSRTATLLNMGSVEPLPPMGYV